MVAFKTARDALECSVAMQQASARTIESPSAIRIGVSSGDVVVEEDDCFGMPVVEASRLCAHAAAGQILLAESTRLLARDYAPIEARGALELKGLPEATTVWEACWSADPGPGATLGPATTFAYIAMQHATRTDHLTEARDSRPVDGRAALQTAR